MKQERTETKYQPKPEVNLRDYVRIVLARKWLVFLIFLAVFGASIYYIKRATLVYETRAALMREQTDKIPANIIGLSGRGINTCTPFVSAGKFFASSTVVTWTNFGSSAASASSARAGAFGAMETSMRNPIAARTRPHGGGSILLVPD